jgi:hypothetical protein
MPRPLYDREKNPRYAFDRNLDGPQRRSGLHGEVKILAPNGTQTPSYEPTFNLVKYEELIYLEVPAVFLYSFIPGVFKTEITIGSIKRHKSPDFEHYQENLAMEEVKR